jgi:hypothetical protein
MAQKVKCSCGTDMTIVRQYDADPQGNAVTEVQYCATCVLAAYHLGFTDGGGTWGVGNKTTAVSVMASAMPGQY